MQHLHYNIPYLFGFWADSVAHLLLLKSSMPRLIHNFIQCSWEGQSCGRRGLEKRDVDCVDQNGRKVRKIFCKRNLAKMPKKSRKCAKKICKFDDVQGPIL